MARNIVHKWFFNHPPQTVWKFLTEPELLAQWLMENDFQPVVGHQFRFISHPKIKFGFDGIVYCKVLEVEPLKRLSYSWKGGPGKGKINLDSVVVWTLIEKDNGTELVLEHKGFKLIENFMAYVAMNEGWRTKIYKRLLTMMNTKDSILTK